MCGGGGMVQQGPTAQEIEQQSLTNKLLSGQIADAAKVRAADDYKQSPAYLNQQLAGTRTTQKATYDTGKSTTYQNARKNLVDQFTAFGDPGAAAPYLAALDNDYNSLQYHPGGEYTTVGATGPTGPTKVSVENFDANRYLQGNPDVMQEAGRLGRNPIEFAQQHFISTGQAEGRTYGDGSAGNAGQVQAPGADTWDDYTKLATNDYGAGAYLDSKRLERKDTAYNAARDSSYRTLAAMGLDEPTQTSLMNSLNNNFQSKYNQAGLSANDYSNAFDGQAVLDSTLGQARNSKRSGYTTAVNSAFAGIDPNKDFDDTADDNYINSLVGKQYGDASGALERAFKRGALTDMGYNSGMSYLGDQNKSALSSAQSLGGAVLQKNRDALGNVVSGAKTAASGWDFGQNFDVNKFMGDYTSKKGALSGSLEGDITNALSGQNWFDVGDVLTKAGYAQGAQNTAPLTEGYTTPGLAGIAGQRDKDKSATRGLGGVGVF